MRNGKIHPTPLSEKKPRDRRGVGSVRNVAVIDEEHLLSHSLVANYISNTPIIQRQGLEDRRDTLPGTLQDRTFSALSQSHQEPLSELLSQHAASLALLCLHIEFYKTVDACLHPVVPWWGTHGLHWNISNATVYLSSLSSPFSHFPSANRH